MLVDLTLTPDDFLEGSPCNPHGCPTQIALRRLVLPGIKVIVQPENALIWDAINPVMHTVLFPAELVKVIERHDDHSTVLLEPETFTLDIPQEVLRDGIEESREDEEHERQLEADEEEFAQAIRLVFAEVELESTGDNWSVVKIGEPRELRYGPGENKKAA